MGQMYQHGIGELIYSKHDSISCIISRRVREENIPLDDIHVEKLKK